MDYHFSLYTDETPAICDRCKKTQGIDEFATLCAVCWSELTPEQRSVIRGEEQPVVEIRREVIHVINPPNRVLRAVLFAWRVAVTALLAYGVWRMGGLRLHG